MEDQVAPPTGPPCRYCGAPVSREDGKFCNGTCFNRWRSKCAAEKRAQRQAAANDSGEPVSEDLMSEDRVRDELLREELVREELARQQRQAQKEQEAAQRAAVLEQIAAGSPVPALAPQQVCEPSSEVREQLQQSESEYKNHLRQLKQQRAKELVRQARAAAEGKRLPPVWAVPYRRRIDPTYAAAIDPETGKPYGTPGYAKVWVSEHDITGNPGGSYTVFGRLTEGYQIVRRPDGSEVRSPFGVLMEVSPRRKAEREISYMPEGGIAPADYFAAQLEEAAEQENLRARERVISIYREQEHRSYRSTSEDG